MSYGEKVIYKDHNDATVVVLTSVCVAPGEQYHIYHDNLERPVNVVFQRGLIGEVGVNGIQNEHLLAILIDRTKELNSNFPCKENVSAIEHMEQALALFEHRTKDRIQRQVEGQYKL